MLMHMLCIIAKLWLLLDLQVLKALPVAQKCTVSCRHWSNICRAYQMMEYQVCMCPLAYLLSMS